MVDAKGGELLVEVEEDAEVQAREKSVKNRAIKRLLETHSRRKEG